VPVDSVISADDVQTIYEVPLMFRVGGLDEIIVSKLNLKTSKPKFSSWEKFVDKVKHPSTEIRIAVCGKYVELKDSYKSIAESFVHAGVANDARVKLEWVEAEDIEKNGAEKYLANVRGLLVPGGFGNRGSEGKVLAIKYAREKKIPFFGICLGLQCAVIEFARNVCGLQNANSTEFNENTPHPVIDLMEEQKRIKSKGGTMRLGSQPCKIRKDTIVLKIYKTELVNERHRHRLEVNEKYYETLQKNGLVLSGINPQLDLVETIELPNHPWFVGVQFHPELKSRPLNPHPLFRDFVRAAIKCGKK
jgi:CTP synthase